jgi:tight adherence protein B
MLILLTIATFVAVLGLLLSATYLLVLGPLAKKELMSRLVRLEQVSSGPEESPELLRKDKYSDIEFVNNVLTELPGTTKLNLFLKQAAVGMHVGPFLALVVAVAFCGLLAGLLLQLPGSFVFLLFVLPPMIPFFVVSTKRRRRLARFEELFPEAIDLLARAVRSSHAFTTGFELIGTELPDPVGEEFRYTFRQQKLGMPLRDALEDMMVRVPLPDVRIFVSALQIQRESGGNLGEILDTLSEVIRERFKLMRDVRTHTAEGRLSMYVLSAIPPIGGFLLYLGRPDYMKPLFVDPRGQAALAVAAGLQVIGYWVIGRIIRIKV